MKLLSDKKNILFGLAFSYVSLAISLIGSFFITPIILNNVGDKSYGLFSFCNSITSWLSIISTSLGASYIYFANKEKKENGSISRTNTIFSKMLFLLSGLVALLSLVFLRIMDISGFQFANYGVEDNQIILILLLISSMNVAVTIFFSAFSLYNNLTKSFAFVRGVQIISSILIYGLNLLFACTIKSIIPIALVSLGGALINGILNFWYAIKAKNMIFSKVKLSHKESNLPLIVKYSSIILISTIIVNLDSNLDKTLLGLMVNAESVAMYQLSITFSTHLLVLSFSFTEVMRPTIYELYRNEKITEANALFLKISKIQTIVVLLIIGGYLSCGYHFVTFWIGSERIDVFYYSSALFLSSIVPLTKSADGEALKASNLHKTTTILSIASITTNAIISITLLLLIDHKYAIWSCIIGTIIAKILFSWIIIPIYIYKKIKLPINQYYLNLLKSIVLTSIAVFPAIIISISLNNVDMKLILKVLIEGLIFVSIYMIEMVIFERKTLKYLFCAYLKK